MNWTLIGSANYSFEGLSPCDATPDGRRRLPPFTLEMVSRRQKAGPIYQSQQCLLALPVIVHRCLTDQM